MDVLIVDMQSRGDSRLANYNSYNLINYTKDLFSCSKIVNTSFSSIIFIQVESKKIILKDETAFGKMIVFKDVEICPLSIGI